MGPRSPRIGQHSVRRGNLAPRSANIASSGGTLAPAPRSANIASSGGTLAPNADLPPHQPQTRKHKPHTRSHKRRSTNVKPPSTYHDRLGPHRPQAASTRPPLTGTTCLSPQCMLATCFDALWLHTRSVLAGALAHMPCSHTCLHSLLCVRWPQDNCSCPTPGQRCELFDPSRAQSLWVGQLRPQQPSRGRQPTHPHYSAASPSNSLALPSISVTCLCFLCVPARSLLYFPIHMTLSQPTPPHGHPPANHHQQRPA